MRKGASEIVVVLDRSGSMSSTKTDAEGGLKEFLKKQSVLPGDCRLTFYRFDNEIERVFEDRRLWEVRDEELKLEPRGSTALLDAIAKAIDEVGARLARASDYDRPEFVYVVIVTDGYENASRLTTEDVFKRITHQRDTYKWQFIFIGANQDAIASAAKIGIGHAQSLSYAANAIGTQNSYNALHNTIQLSRTTGQAACFSQDDRDAAMAKTAPIVK